MNPRTKWLAVAALTIFGLYGADQIYRSQIEEPTSRLTADLDRLTNELQDSMDQQTIANKTNRRLDSYQQRALPYDPQLARSAYQEWLLRLVEGNRIQSASVDAAQPRLVEIRSRLDRRKRLPVGNTILYSVRGQGTLSQWTDLLYEFRRAGHLHKIRNLSLNPLGSEGQLDVNLTIEVLSLVSATRKEELSDWIVVGQPLLPRDEYGEFVRRNLFARGFSKALFDIQLKAITYDRSGQAEAWLSTDAGGSAQPILSGQQLPVALHDISLVEIQPGRALVQINGTSVWVTLGQTLGEACNTAIDIQPSK